MTYLEVPLQLVDAPVRVVGDRALDLRRIRLPYRRRICEYNDEMPVVVPVWVRLIGDAVLLASSPPGQVTLNPLSLHELFEFLPPLRQ